LTTLISDSVFGILSDVTGLQWYWTFDGNDVALNSVIGVGDLFGLSVSNSAIISAGTFAFALSAVDVIHAVALPTLAVKADAIPGRCVLVRFAVELSGNFVGQCSELCGAMHGFMPIAIVAV
jgi:cytochrome c oxidase subunit 2